MQARLFEGANVNSPPLAGRAPAGAWATISDASASAPPALRVVPATVSAPRSIAAVSSSTQSAWGTQSSSVKQRIAPLACRAPSFRAAAGPSPAARTSRAADGVRPRHRRRSRQSIRRRPRSPRADRWPSVPRARPGTRRAAPDGHGSERRRRSAAQWRYAICSTGAASPALKSRSASMTLPSSRYSASVLTLQTSCSAPSTTFNVASSAVHIE